MLSRRRFTRIPPNTPCVRSRRLVFKIRAVMLSVVHFPHLGFTCAGVAPLPPLFRKFLAETVKTFALFPSCEQLLDCDDKCMLSVPLSTSDLHFYRWQSGENCQVVSTGAFTLLCHAFWFSLKCCSSPFLLSCPRVVCSIAPVFSA